MPHPEFLRLCGCTPEPLGNYLKALGVFRLVAEQADPEVRCWWRRGVFHLFSPGGRFQDSGRLADWFLNECQFSAFIAPWQTGVGFLPLGKRSKGTEALGRMLTSDRSAYKKWHKAFEEFTSAIGVKLPAGRDSWISATHRAAEATELSQEVDEGNAGEAHIHRILRKSMTDPAALAWLDAVGSLVPERGLEGEAQAKWFWLLASGGGESSGQYIVNLEQRLAKKLDEDRDVSRSQLLASLHGRQFPGALEEGAMGAMYYPALIKGFNSGQQFSSKPDRRVNPWDFILLLEGTLLWASAATRRQWVNRQLASFPFYCRASLGGSSAAAPKEVQGAEGSISRGEVWCPLWASPSSVADLRPVFAEGRIQVGEKTAASSLEFVRSVARFGTERGVAAFVRYGLLARSGSGRQTTLLAVPLGTFVPRCLADVDLLDDLDGFRQQVEQSVQPHANQPRRIVLSRLRFEQAMFAFAAQLLSQDAVEHRRRLLDVLVSAAALERELGVTGGEVKHKQRNQLEKRSIAPIQPISSRWLFRESGQGWTCPIDDNSAEFRLARSIASIGPWGEIERDGRTVRAVESLRANLLPLTRFGKEWSWDPKAKSAVWVPGLPLMDNLGRVLQRRLVDAGKGKGEGLPLWSSFGARFSDVLSVWAGQVDEQRLEELTYALALIDHLPSNERAVAVRQVDSDPTPDLAQNGVWFDPQDRPHVDFVRPVWNGRPLLSPDDLQAATTLPRAYALLKLCFVGGGMPPRPTEGRTVPRTGSEPPPPLDAAILNLLLAGRAEDALGRAAQKLRAKGYPVFASDQLLRSGGFTLTAAESRRLAGLLLVPVNNAGVLAALSIKPKVC